MVQAEIWKLLGNKGDKISFIVADGSTIEVGDFLELADPMTVTAHSTNDDTPIVGIAFEKKLANDGKVLITGITNCIFKATIDAGGTCTIGDLVSMGTTAGKVEIGAATDFETGWTVGRAYESATAGETGLFKSTF